MAPFKLKFRMGSSRSTSQETDPDPQATQALLQNSVNGIGASCSTLDSTDCTSLASLGISDQHSLLPNGQRIGYLNPSITENSMPHSPPPSYEQAILEEKQNQRLVNLQGDSKLTPVRQSSLRSEAETPIRGGKRISGHESFEIGSSSVLADDSGSNVCILRNPSVERITVTCRDPDCTLLAVNENSMLDGRRGSITSTMTTPSTEENFLDCAGSCDPLLSSRERITCNDDKHSQEQRRGQHFQQDLDDEQQRVMECAGGVGKGVPAEETIESGECHCNNEEEHQHQQGQCQSSEEDDNYSDNDWRQSQSQSYQPVPQHQHQNEPTSETISNKSSKQIYKAVAKQWGITCKMSDQCRCMECQSHYFDCDYDDNDHEKTDGGLGAGTPMFVSEVMHGSACSIL